MLKRIAAMVSVLVLVAAVPAMAKPVSTYSAEFHFPGSVGGLSVVFDDYEVTSVKLSMSCGDSGVFSYDSTSIDGGSFVTVGPKADRFEVSAQFTAQFTDCDGTTSTVSRFVQVSDFTTIGAIDRQRDRSTGTRTLAVPVEAQVSLPPLANQPLPGVLTEVISKG